MPRLIKQNETLALRRRMYFHLVGTNGVTPALAEAGGQPQIAINGAAWATTNIGTLTAIGNGRYYADLTEAAVANIGDEIETQYFSLNTAVCPGDSALVVSYDPYSGSTTGLGEGTIVVDHNYGGADMLAYKTGSNHGIEGATISCYLTSEYNGGHYTNDFVVAATTTDFNGQWRNPMMLDPNDYTLIYFKQGDYGPDRRNITVS